MEKLSTPSANRFRYRAWDKSNLEMFEVRELKFHSSVSNPYTVFGIYGDGSDAEDVILMQSTGLLDKNGKELWEGELLEEREKGTPFIARGVIEWRNGAWMVHLFCTASRKPDYIGHDLGWYFVHDRIQPRMDDDPAVSVGNRYENPELLPSA